MSKRLLDVDALTGIKTFHDYDHSTKKTIITEEQDVQSILKQNKIDANSGKNTNKGDYKHFARVPLVILEQWKKEHGVDWRNPDHSKKLEQLLMKSENKFLRTCDRI